MSRKFVDDFDIDLDEDFDDEDYAKKGSELDKIFSKKEKEIKKIANGWIVPQVPNNSKLEKALSKILSSVELDVDSVVSASYVYNRNPLYSSSILFAPALVKSFAIEILDGPSGVRTSFFGPFKKSPKRLVKIDTRPEVAAAKWIASIEPEIIKIYKDYVPGDDKIYKSLSKYSSRLESHSQDIHKLASKISKNNPNTFHAIRAIYRILHGLSKAIKTGIK